MQKRSWRTQRESEITAEIDLTEIGYEGVGRI
jgi:hypothetical protein